MKKAGGRIVEPEWLDEMPPQDARALRSRRDLRRLNNTMRHPQIMARAVSENLEKIAAPRIVELGAGDGHFLLSVLRQLPAPKVPRTLASGHSPGMPDKDPALVGGEPRPPEPDAVRGEAVLVDQLAAFAPDIYNARHDIGWRVKTEIAGVFEWLQKADPNCADAIICNLFLHHFQASALSELLRLIARCTNVFIALEPRRSWFPMLCGRFLWSIGCGPVTRHDAIVSIRAGFSGCELSSLWPKATGWHVEERPAGLFSHQFIARRKE